MEDLEQREIYVRKVACKRNEETTFVVSMECMQIFRTETLPLCIIGNIQRRSSVLKVYISVYICQALNLCIPGRHKYQQTWA